MDGITLTEDDLKIDDSKSKTADKKTGAFARFVQAIRNAWDEARFNLDLNFTPLSKSNHDFIDRGEQNRFRLDALSKDGMLPGMTVAYNSEPYVAPKGPQKKNEDNKTDSKIAGKWDDLSVEERKLLDYLKKYFGESVLTSPHLTKDYLKETASSYRIKENLFNFGPGLPFGNRLGFTNRDKNTKSSFVLKQEKDGSVSSLYTGDREKFADNVNAWAKNLLINQNGPMTVTLTSGTPKEKYLMKLALEAYSAPNAEISVIGFDDSTLTAEQKADIKGRWEKTPSGAPKKERPTRKARVIDDITADQDAVTKDASTAVADSEKDLPLTKKSVKDRANRSSTSTSAETPARETAQKVVDKESFSFSQETSGKKSNLPRGVTKETFAKAEEHVIASGITSAKELTKQFGMTDAKARAILEKLESDGVLTPRGIAPPKAA